MSNSAFLASRYMTNFHCLGASCEDHCCGGWQVIVDREHYKKLEQVACTTKKERVAFKRSFDLREAALRSAGFHAYTRLDADGNCVFLDPHRLCKIQRRYGEDFLPNTCCVYPRHASRLANHCELLGDLSCPEVARLCLLVDGSTEMLDFDPQRAGRLTIRQALDTYPQVPYVKQLEDVRRVMVLLLDRHEYPVSSRLFFTAYLARRLGEFFRPENDEMDQERFMAELDAICNPALWAELHQMITDFKSEDSAAPAVVLEVLRVRRGSLCSNKFLYLVEEALGRPLVGLSSDPKLAETSENDFEQLTETYQRRKQSLSPRLASRVELYFENYAKNFWLKEWYVNSPSIFAHTQNLLVRIAVLRFLLLNQPLIETLHGADEQTAEVDQSTLDARAIEVFYAFSRVMEHDKELIEAVTNSLIKHQMLALGQSIALLKW